MLEEIAAQDIVEYMDYLSYYENEEGEAITNDERGKQRKLASLRSMYNYFFKMELIEKNPAALVDFPKLHKKEIIRLDPGEVATLLDNIENGEDLTEQIIEEFVEELSVSQGQALVKVDTLAICKADIRYFLGLRSKAVLDHKYPLTPIHEAVGYVVKDYTGLFKHGDKVILVPNYVDKSKCATCVHKRCPEEALGENYCPNATFLSSTKDGFLKPFVAGTEKTMVKIDDSMIDFTALKAKLPEWIDNFKEKKND
mgnify:CR=1 FL=1